MRSDDRQGSLEILNSRIDLLPTSASSFFGEEFKSFEWCGELAALLAGTRDEESVLNLLRGFEDTLLRNVYSYYASEWAPYVTLTIPAPYVGRFRCDKMVRFPRGRGGLCSFEVADDLPTVSRTPFSYVSFALCGHIQFPEPTGRNVNMMPFIFGEKGSLPLELQCYHECIELCPYGADERGKVGYLTVHESFVEQGSAQRREGLHIETPGHFIAAEENCSSTAFKPGVEHHWGEGHFFGPDEYEGGIFMASSVAGTSILYDALVDKRVKGITDRHGGCEHLRGLVGKGTVLDEHELVWMTDRTPHEALPQESAGCRQFFRVVTHSVSHWFSAHSTPNPLVPLPADVIIVPEDKFS